MTVAYRWKKARGSQSEGACVELGNTNDKRLGVGVVRDSKNPDGPMLVVDLPALTASALSGRLDLH